MLIRFGGKHVLNPLWLLLGMLLAPLAQAALPFAVATVEFREVDQTYAAEALVEAVRQSTVAAQISGRIVEVNFDVGETVKKAKCWFVSTRAKPVRRSPAARL